MRIVFIGASKFGLRCLERVVGIEACEVVGIVTSPETFGISYRPEGVRNVLHADFCPVSDRHGIPCVTMKSKMTDPEISGSIERWLPDAIVVVGWYHMIPKRVRDIAPTLGLHASLLPDYSGGAPLVWAILNGEEQTGITLFQMDAGVDTGPVLGQRAQPIHPDDTIATLYARIEEDGLSLLEEHLPKLANGTAVFVGQDESDRRVMPQRSPEDGLIDWSLPAKRIYDFVRGQTRPYPGAFSHLGAEKLTLWEARPGAPQDGTRGAGEVWREGGEVRVACGDAETLVLGALRLGDEEIDARDLPLPAAGVRLASQSG